MNTAELIAALEAERNRLDRAIDALTAGSRNGRGPRGRRKRKKLSAAAKRRISLAMKRKWAERKRSA